MTTTGMTLLGVLRCFGIAAFMDAAIGRGFCPDRVRAIGAGLYRPDVWDDGVCATWQMMVEG